MARGKIAFPYIILALTILGIVWSNTRHRSEYTPPPDFQGERITDPVCHMDVNPAWNFRHTLDDTEYWFCSKRCVKLFSDDPESYLGDRCIVCRKLLVPANSLTVTYLERPYFVCSAEHRAEFKTDPAGFFMHRMWGIPDWLYYLSIGIILVVSFAIFEGKKLFRKKANNPSPVSENSSPPAQPSKERWNLLQMGWIKRSLLSRPFRFVLQLIMVGFFLLILLVGLFGHQNPALNVAPLLTWTIWWCGLVLLIMFFGKVWCYVCPWDALAGWLEKMRWWKKNDNGMGLALPWPRILCNITLATVLFVGLTWVELGFGVTMSPKATAYLGIALLAMAIVAAFLFERKSFCRYGCLVGRVSGLYALFAGIEFRRDRADVCRSCRSKECIKGSDTAYPCPTFENPSTMKTNTYCIQCTECLQACPHNNLAVNLRPWGADLATTSTPRSDEAYLALIMLSLSAFHGLTMTPVWSEMLKALESTFPVAPLISFTAGMMGLMILPILIYTVLVWLSYRITIYSRRSDQAKTETLNTSFRDYFIRYAYCVLPIALFYHLAHNLEHLCMEGPKIISKISDPFGWGWNLFGSAQWSIPPIVSLDVLWVLQVLLVGLGHVYSLWAAQKISQRYFGSTGASTRGQLPMVIGMVAFSVLSLWLLKQPMEMRTSAM